MKGSVFYINAKDLVRVYDGYGALVLGETEPTLGWLLYLEDPDIRAGYAADWY